MYGKKTKKKERDERERGAWDGVSGKRQLEARENHNDEIIILGIRYRIYVGQNTYLGNIFNWFSRSSRICNLASLQPRKSQFNITNNYKMLHHYRV